MTPEPIIKMSFIQKYNIFSKLNFGQTFLYFSFFFMIYTLTLLNFNQSYLIWRVLLYKP